MKKNGGEKNLVALQLAYLSPMELFVITRENPKDLEIATEKNLWALVAAQKFGRVPLQEMETFLTTKDSSFEHSCKLADFFGNGKINYFSLILAEYIATQCMHYNSEGKTKRSFGFEYTDTMTLRFTLICETSIDFVAYRRCKFICFPEGDDYFNRMEVDALQTWLKTSWFFIFGVSCKDKIYFPNNDKNEIHCDLRKDTSFKPLFKIIYGLLQVPGVFYRDTSTKMQILINKEI